MAGFYLPCAACLPPVAVFLRLCRLLYSVVSSLNAPPLTRSEKHLNRKHGQASRSLYRFFFGMDVLNVILTLPCFRYQARELGQQ